MSTLSLVVYSLYDNQRTIDRATIENKEINRRRLEEVLTAANHILESAVHLCVSRGIDKQDIAGVLGLEVNTVNDILNNKLITGMAV